MPPESLRSVQASRISNFFSSVILPISQTQEFRSEGVKPLSENEACHILRHAARVHSLHVSKNEYFLLPTALSIETCVFSEPMMLKWEPNTITGLLPLFLSPTLRRCVLSAVFVCALLWAELFRALIPCKACSNYSSPSLI
jgi:hypothetical protein